MALVFCRVGATLILLKQFQPKTILKSIAEHKATFLPLVPTIYSFLVDLYVRDGYDVSSLHTCISGGSALPVALLEKVEEVLVENRLKNQTQYFGRTKDLTPVIINNISDEDVGNIIKVKIDKCDKKSLFGRKYSNEREVAA